MSLPLSFSFDIDVTTRSEWANIDHLRGSVQHAFVAVFKKIDGCDTIAMVTGELLENAVKYGNWERPSDGLLNLRVWCQDRRATVRVSNPCRASDHAEIVHTLKWIAGFATAAEAYKERLQEIAREPRGTGISKLGLVRISYEGNCKLSAELDGEILTVSADMNL